jgi:hypothetical protein
MASRVTTEQSAAEAVWAYLAEQRPGKARLDLSVLRLEQGWLVQTAPDVNDLGAEQFVLLVNRYGFVEAVGRNAVSRRNAQRYLTGRGPLGMAQKAG